MEKLGCLLLDKSDVCNGLWKTRVPHVDESKSEQKNKFKSGKLGQAKPTKVQEFLSGLSAGRVWCETLWNY
jgi:hypothetical protein